jgi:hypothetical protein
MNATNVPVISTLFVGYNPRPCPPKPTSGKLHRILQAKPQHCTMMVGGILDMFVLNSIGREKQGCVLCRPPTNHHHTTVLWFVRFVRYSNTCFLLEKLVVVFVRFVRIVNTSMNICIAHLEGFDTESRLYPVAINLNIPSDGDHDTFLSCAFADSMRYNRFEEDWHDTYNSDNSWHEHYNAVHPEKLHNAFWSDRQDKTPLNVDAIQNFLEYYYRHRL